MKSYKDLDVWHRGMDLCVTVYDLTRDFPSEERYGLSQQLRRASVSIVSNIAEGYGRRTARQRYHFLEQALGSTYETETQLLVASRLELAPASAFESAQRLVKDVGRGLVSLMRYVQSEAER